MRFLKQLRILNYLKQKNYQKLQKYYLLELKLLPICIAVIGKFTSKNLCFGFLLGFFDKYRVNYLFYC